MATTTEAVSDKDVTLAGEAILTHLGYGFV